MTNTDNNTLLRDIEKELDGINCGARYDHLNKKLSAWTTDQSKLQVAKSLHQLFIKEREGFAVKFAEWILNSDYGYSEKKWFSDDLKSEKTTQQLFDLYTKTLNK